MIKWIGDPDLTIFNDSGGTIVNTSDTAVLLRMPDFDEIKQLWSAFEVELRARCLSLLSMRNDEVLQRYGSLGRSDAFYQRHPTAPWGLMPMTIAYPKGFQRIETLAAQQALIDSGIVAARTVRGAARRQTRDGSGGVANFVLTQPAAIQRKFLETVISGDIDTTLTMPQTCQIGLAKMKGVIEAALSAEQLLEWLASELQTQLMERDTKGSADSTRKGAGRWFAPIWFGYYLARQGLWLLPLRYFSKVVYAFPTWARPIQIYLSVPEQHHQFCDELIQTHLVKAKNASYDALVILSLITSASSSNIWQFECPSAAGLVEIKRWVQKSSKASMTQRSWALNRLWEAIEHSFDVVDDTSARAFSQSLRLASRGTVAFNWVFHPHPKNLKAWRRIYGTEFSEAPPYLKSWADELTNILPLFHVKAIDNKINTLNAWLYYIAGLDHLAPKNFREINRSVHINDPSNPSANTFKSFLKKYFVDIKSIVAQNAMSDLRQAWQLAALKDGFADKLVNPIDPQFDAPTKAPNHRSHTVRKALDMRALEVISAENLRDEMVFARDFGGRRKTCWRWVRDPESGERQQIFFPAAPLMVNLICHSGMRGSQCRWLDSGEGDELSPDVVRKVYEKNPDPVAQRGRKEGVLRLMSVQGQKRETVVGMWINTGKTGPHEVPWIHPDLVEPITVMAAFQKKWAPMKAPIKCVDPDFLDDLRVTSDTTSFPIFRDPSNRLGLPLTQKKLLDYWRALLIHCQPLVDESMGYHYPLILADGSLNFDIHSLRVTVVTTLLDHGVPVYVVQMLVGHKSPIMTWYYQDVTDSKIHHALQVAIETRKTKLRDLDTMTGADEDEFLSESIIIRDTNDHIGSEIFRKQRREGNFIDVFAHGICPGRDCETGGPRLAEGRYGPVWRKRACSGCRYRVTGPAFLNGLVQRLNGLMWEIKSSTHKEAEINEEIEAAEDRNQATRHLHSQIRNEQELRDRLAEEWCLELKTIRNAEASLRKQGDEHSGAPTLYSQLDMRDTFLAFTEVHEFALAQTLVSDSRVVEGSVLDLPANIEEYRDNILRKIAFQNEISRYYYSPDKKAARRALDLFGDIILSHSNSEGLQELIDGTALVKDFPALYEDVTELTSAIESSRLIGIPDK